MNKEKHLIQAVFLLTVSVPLSGFAQKDLRHNELYLEAINHEAQLTDAYQQPAAKRNVANSSQEKITSVEQALERLRQYSLPTR